MNGPIHIIFCLFYNFFCVDLEITHRNTHMATLTYTNEYYVSTFFIQFYINLGKTNKFSKILLLHILYIFSLVYIYIIDEILEKDIFKGGDVWWW